MFDESREDLFASPQLLGLDDGRPHQFDCARVLGKSGHDELLELCFGEESSSH